MEEVQEQITGMDKMLENLKKDEAGLQVKMDKKKTELDRHSKRLQSLVSSVWAVGPRLSERRQPAPLRPRRPAIEPFPKIFLPVILPRARDEYQE